MLHEVTERGDTEEQDRLGESRFQAIFEGVAIGMAVADKHCRIVKTNRALQAMLGYSAEELRAMDFCAISHPDDARSHLDCFRDMFAGRKPSQRLDKRYVRKDGTIVWGQVSISLVRQPDEEPYAVVMVEDVTERKITEKKLRERDEQYHSIFEATSDGIIITDADGVVVEANPAACAMHGYRPDEFVGLHETAYVAPVHHELLIEQAKAIVAGERIRQRGANVRRDGTVFPVDLQGTSFRYHGKPHVLAVVRDVTEQVRAYELLESRVEERTRELSTLLDVSREVASTLQVQPLLDLILDQLKTMVEYTSGSLASIRDGRLEFLSYSGPVEPQAREHVRAGLEQASRREEFRRGELIMVDDLWGDSEVARDFQVLQGDELQRHFKHACAWMGVPLMVGQNLIGMLSLVHSEPGFFSPQHGRLALAMGQQAAVAIENARLYEQAQEYAAHDERARLARELHDSVTQTLFSMTMHAGAAEIGLDREGVDPQGHAARNLRQLNELAQGALAEMRALIFELRPGALAEEGLVLALRKHCAALSARERLPVVVEASDDRLPIDATAEEHLYRLTQEALNNTIKHARARLATVKLESGECGLTLEIVDDGVGFDSQGVPSGHLGLRTMADRVRQIGGRLEVESGRGAGTSVRVVLPNVVP